MRDVEYWYQRKEEGTTDKKGKGRNEQDRGEETGQGGELLMELSPLLLLRSGAIPDPLTPMTSRSIMEPLRLPALPAHGLSV
uniref:Uncharacterized protein n=1 Tax=Utricularia reniformis TaxID=192314 RepID=A0A1Y0B263_9LAMI|nr:hypothetical protein AEK19_MT1283 [Utricularia reniformis]ART31487.1 hypothetical protein AEK19_MT1283 [Utricularia reniformis]